MNLKLMRSKQTQNGSSNHCQSFVNVLIYARQIVAKSI